MQALRRGWTLLTASDPGLARLRLASTTLVTLVLAVLAVGGVALAWGQPVTAAVVGVVVAMIASLTVNDPSTSGRAVSTALLVPGVAVSAGLSVTFRDRLWLSDAVFVLVMVAAVYLRRWGPRGLAVGMVSFVTYFMALFVRATPSQLPGMVVGAAVGATISFGVRTVLAPRHPDRDLRRELGAWSVRAGRVLDTLAEAVTAGRWEGRARHRLRQRVLACAEAAGAAEARLDGADDRVWAVVRNDDLAVRVFDVQLALERVVSLCVDQVGGDEGADPGGPGGRELASAPRAALAAALGDLRARLAAADAGRTATGRRHLDPVLASALDRCAEAWARTWRPESDPEPEAEPDASARVLAADRGDEPVVGDGSVEDSREDPAGSIGDEGDGSGAPRWRELSRTALQVAVAAVVAIVLGELLSPTRWFWAVIAAFVVFTGTSTREETLQKGWLRVLGTLAGVVAGVLVASLVGDRTALAVVAIALCLFLGIYLLRISIAWMMFFVTAMLGLLYGLMGMFSIGLLLTRLEETAAGAAAGALAAYLVLPQRARRAATKDIGEVLESLEELLESVGRTLTGESADPHGRAGDPPGPPGNPGPPANPARLGDDLLGRARRLRTAMATLRTTASPLTGPLAGLTNRTGLRRVVMVVGACEHHGRSLARVSDAAAGVASGPRRSVPVSRAVSAVAGTVHRLRPAVDVGGPAPTVELPVVDAQLEEARQVCEDLGGHEHELLWSVLRHLRAIDGAMRQLARDLAVSPGARVG